MNSTTTALIFFFTLLAICLAPFCALIVIPKIQNLRAPKLTVYAEVVDMTTAFIDAEAVRTHPLVSLLFKRIMMNILRFSLTKNSIIHLKSEQQVS